MALDTELHRGVALKEVRDQHVDDGNSRARFVREAEITGGREHLGIVSMVEAALAIKAIIAGGSGTGRE